MSVEGAILRTYRIGPELGRGAMGVVHRAETLRAGPAGPPGTAVAVKVLHGERLQAEDAFERFRAEARIGREVHHPNLVRIYELAQDDVDGAVVQFLVMELIEGRTLEAIREEQGSVPASLLARVAEGVAQALAAIHERGIVHRDVKPGNVVLAEDERVVLMDFGIATHTRSRARLAEDGFTGSMPYAAPEQFAAEEVGARADQYALGILLYELATGTNPFDGMTVTAILREKLERELAPPQTVNPSLPAFWNAVIAASVQSVPTRRFPSAALLAHVLAEGEAGAWWQRRLRGVAEASPERALRRLETERRARVVGRTDAERALMHATRTAEAGGTVVLVEGATGTGKTRLLAEHVHRIAGAGGPTVVAGRGAGTGQRAYGPITEALHDVFRSEDDVAGSLAERLAPHLPNAVDIHAPMAAFLEGTLQPGPESGLSKDAAFAALVDLIRSIAREHPLVVLVDDLHLAGDESVELFQHLTRRVDDAPVLLGAAYDLEDAAVDGALSTFVDDQVKKRGPTRVRLAPLRVEEAEALVRQVVGHERTVREVLAPLHTQSEGNPLIMLDVLEHLEQTGALREEGAGLVLTASMDTVPVPSSVRDLVSLKVGRLDEDERELLEVAAILGPAFDAAALAEVLEEDPVEVAESLSALEARHGLVTHDGDGRYGFARYALFEAVYAGIAPALRAEYHDLVADALLAGPPPEGERAYALLRHLLHAERAGEAAPFLEAALAFMDTRFHATFTAPVLERVADGLGGAPPAKRLALSMAQWSVYDRLARREDQLRVLDVAHEMAARGGDRTPLARIHGLRAGSYWYAGDYDRALEEAEAGLACARTTGDRTWEATCLHTIGVVAFRRGELQRCAELWRRALAIRREIDDRKGQASTLQALSLILPAIGEGERVLETMEASLALWRSIGERRGESSMLMNIGNHLVDAARYEEGLEHLERALAGHRDTGAVINETLTLTNLGRAQHAIGRIDDARDSWEQALELFIELENPNGEMATRLNLGGALWLYGEGQEAEEQLEATIALAERLRSPTHHIMALRDLGALRHAMGDRDAAWVLLERALALEDELGSTMSRIDTVLVAAHAALREGASERAAGLLEPVLDDARKDATRAPLTLLRLARAYAQSGNPGDAAALAGEALDPLGDGSSVSRAEAPELYFSLFELLTDHPRNAAFLDRARSFMDDRAAQIRTDAYRAHFLTQIWPHSEIRAAIRARG